MTDVPSSKKPADKPYALTDMAAHQAELEAERAKLYPQWRAALEAAGGNISRAAEQQDPVITRDRAQRLTRRLGLVAFAADLRAKGGTGARVTEGSLKGKVMGRPRRPADKA